VQIFHERNAGLDIGKQVVVACVRRPDKDGGRKQQVRSSPHSSTTRGAA
jgi:hypothetical protein